MNSILNKNELRTDAKLKTASVSLNDFTALAQGKSIYILSVNLEGMGLANRFKYLGFDVSAFVDSRYDNLANGLPVIKPEVFFQNSDISNNILIEYSLIQIRLEQNLKVKPFPTLIKPFYQSAKIRSIVPLLHTP
jgi:hypothetical protein